MVGGGIREGGQDGDGKNAGESGGTGGGLDEEDGPPSIVSVRRKITELRESVKERRREVSL